MHALLDYILLVVGSLCIGGFAVRKLISKSPDLQQVSEAVAKQAEEVKVQQVEQAEHDHKKTVAIIDSEVKKINAAGLTKLADLLNDKFGK